MLLESKRVLYIEDDERNRKLVKLILEAAGAEIHFDKWGTPGMALSSVMSHLPLDVILLDLMLPRGFSGFSIYEALREQAVLDDIPIVVVSAADPEVEMKRARELGVNGYIAKPIDATQFAQQIRRVIDGQAVWQT